jgi:hypothetical protein
VQTVFVSHDSSRGNLGRASAMGASMMARVPALAIGKVLNLAFLV